MRSANQSNKKKALFLDRDGVINKDKNYVYRIEDVEFLNGIFQFCEFFQNKGYLIIVVTNQAGIARGFYNAEDFDILDKWMTSYFREKNITITKSYFCPHHPEITGPCDCRKPAPGMILQAAEDYNLNLPESILVGNNESDIKAGENAGIKRNYLLKDSSDFQWIINEEKEY